HLALTEVGAERDHVRAVLLTHPIRHLAHRARLDAVELARHQLHSADVEHNFLSRRAAGACGELLLHRAELFLQLLFARQKFFEPLDRRAVARAELRADFLEDLLALANRFERAIPRHRFYSPHSRRDARFRFEFENADVAGARDVGAAA